MSKGKNKKYPNITSTVSATETTGSMPVPPENEFEQGELRELAGLETPNVKRHRGE